MNSFSTFSAGKPMDFMTTVAGPCASAAQEHSNYEAKCQEHEEKHSPLSLYEMEVMENPHSFQRALMQRMFPRDPNTKESTIPGPVMIFRRMTDSLNAGLDPTTQGQPRVNVFRRMTDSLQKAAFGGNEEEE